MAHPIGEVPHAGLEPDLFERFHREMVDIKNNRKYTYTQRLYDKGYSKSEMQSKRTAINSKYNQKSLMTATTLRALEGLLSQDLFIAIAKDVLQKERYGKNDYDDAKYILETLKQHDPHTPLTVVKYLQKWCQMDTLLKNSHHTVFDTGHKIVALSYKT